MRFQGVDFCTTLLDVWNQMNHQDCWRRCALIFALQWNWWWGACCTDCIADEHSLNSFKTCSHMLCQQRQRGFSRQTHRAVYQVRGGVQSNKLDISCTVCGHAFARTLLPAKDVCMVCMYATITLVKAVGSLSRRRFTIQHCIHKLHLTNITPPQLVTTAFVYPEWVLSSTRYLQHIQH